MAPREHIEWFEDNIAWFAGLDEALLDVAVPACPGWDVHDVLNHLTFGLGLAYPLAMDAPPTAADATVFSAIAWPTSLPLGLAALEAFAAIMEDCAGRFHDADPDRPCWTYAGPGRASFWFRRAAVETTLHRMDVAAALPGQHGQQPLGRRRGRDAIEETLSFALPLAAQMTTVPSRSMRVDSTCLPTPIVVGHGEPAVELSGEPDDILKTLWGRAGETSVVGDQTVADEWLGLVATAFDGR